MAGECSYLLSSVHLQVGSKDQWRWQLDRDNAYSVRGVYHFLTGLHAHQHNAVSDLIGHKYVPLNVSVFT